ncbi:MAG: TonB-dependent receptor [Acidobacteria bacterium]|nr:TonB-dependent receptor [Acidobacteriota bacterium]
MLYSLGRLFHSGLVAERVQKTAALCLLLVLMCLSGLAQQDSGGLVISVRDPNGALVPGAKVTVTNVATNQTAEGVTGDTGDFIASPLRPGQYKATVKRDGFQTAVSEIVRVGAQQIPRVEIKLVVGSVNESVTVAESVTVLQTVDVSKQMTVSGTLQSELPVLDRDYNQLSSLTVGVTLGTPNNARDRFGAGFSASGIKTTQTRYTLDGTDNTSYNQNIQTGRTFAIIPSMDSIAEFTVQTNAFSAEFGGGGGAAVTVITKGGGNRLHGSLFEYRQGADVNANSFFNNARRLRLSPYRYDQYGGTVGGPVYLPKVYDGRNKSFFFFDYERLPRRSPGGLVSANLATPEQVQGNFAGGPVIYDPANGLPFANTTVPAARVDAVARKIADALPRPNTPGAVNYFVGVPNKTDEYRMAVRGDQQLASRDHVFGRYQISRSTTPSLSPFTGTILSTDGTVVQDSRGYVFNETHVFSPTLVNVARYGRTQDDYRTRLALAGQDINSQIGLKGIPIQGAGLTGGLTGISFSNSLSALGGAGPGRGYSEVNQVSDMATWNHGRHLVKMGYEYRRIQFLSFSGGLSPMGQFFFDGHYTSGTGSAGQPFADFLLGLPNRVRFGNLITNDYRRRSHAAFVQDHFQVSPRLTVNFGLRWEYVTPVWEDGGRGSALNVFSRVLQFPGYQGPIPAALQRQVDKGIIKLDRNATRYFNSPPHRRNFGPRVGFAYRLADRTVLRGGYGIYYGAEDIGLWAQPSVGFSVPNQVESSYTPADTRPTTLNPVNFRTGIPADALTNPTGTTIFALDPSLPTPYYQHWNLTAQRELRGKVSVELSYIGARETNVYGQQDYNIPSLTTDASIPYAVRQLFPAVDASGNLIPASDIQAQIASYQGHYHGMGLKVEKRTGSVNLISSYTWSHKLDNFAASGLSYGNNGRPSYPDRWHLNKANGDLDVRHRWASGFVLQAPFGRGQRWASGVNRVTDLLVSGWQISGVFTVESGQWFTPSQNFDTGNNGQQQFCGNCRTRPDYVPGQDPNAGPRLVNPADVRVKWFNVNAFQAAANGTIGNVGRNTVEGPGYGNLDAAIAKNFKLTESSRLKFQAEFYNFTNSVNFLVDNPGSSPNSFRMPNRTPAQNMTTSFGALLADRGGRVLQFSARIDF